MTRSIEVLGIGVAVRDIAVCLDTFPESDRKYQARELTESGGGPVPTALVTLARLGRACGFVGVVGDDVAGRFILEGLRRESVGVDGVVVRREFRSPTSVVLVEHDGGKRTILECSQYDLPLEPADLELERMPLQSCRFLLVDARLVEIQLEVARRVRDGGGRVVLDCGHPRSGVDELLALTDVAILSHTFPREQRGPGYDPRSFLTELHRRLPVDGPRIAGLTLGAEGCAIYTAESGYVRIQGHPVTARDTTGAGDVFHGAFVHALMDGGSPLEAARFANAAAALKCEGRTGRSPLPAEDEIRRLAAAVS